jgi:hypothetical protein
MFPEVSAEPISESSVEKDMSLELLEAESLEFVEVEPVELLDVVLLVLLLDED